MQILHRGLTDCLTLHHSTDSTTLMLTRIGLVNLQVTALDSRNEVALEMGLILLEGVPPTAPSP
jgi:hypothetical protein